MTTPIRTKIQMGETPPSGITTVPPIVKSWRDASHPYDRVSRMPSTRKKRPAAERTAPTTSKRGAGRSRGGSVSPRASQMIVTITMTCRTNEARQPKTVVTNPPMSGPAAAPSPAAPLMTPKYRARVARSAKRTVTRM